MKTFLALIAFCAGASAATPDGDAQGDFAAIARRSLELVERQNGKVTMFVLPADADPALAPALKNLRSVIPRKAIPKAKKYTLPKGYFIVESVKIAGTQGNFTAILGPGELKGTQGADVDCGLRYSISFWKTDGKWENGPFAAQQCTVE